MFMKSDGLQNVFCVADAVRISVYLLDMLHASASSGYSAIYWSSKSKKYNINVFRNGASDEKKYIYNRICSAHDISYNNNIYCYCTLHPSAAH